MLIRFGVENFRSVKEEQVLDLLIRNDAGNETVPLASARGRGISLVTALYGANASGKSNFLRAMNALEYLVMRSAEFRPDQPIAPYEPYRLDEETMEAPVRFSILFQVDGVKYDYEVAFDRDSIVEERLAYYPFGNRKELFYRMGDPPILFGDSYRGPKRVLERMLLPNQLFLSKAAINNVDMLLPAYRFFEEGFSVFPYITDYRRSSMTHLFARRLAEEPDSLFTRRFNALICALDTGISAIRVEEKDWDDASLPESMPAEEKDKIKEAYKYKVMARHPMWRGDTQVGYTMFDFNDESIGTRRLLVVAGLILEALENGYTLVLDEFENNLHTHVGAYLIDLFKKPHINTKGAQLILATHDVTLLSNDRFRRDQIWMVEKDANGASVLYPVSDIGGVRKHAPLDKWYLSGTLGGTPIINDLDFQFLFPHEETVPTGK